MESLRQLAETNGFFTRHQAIELGWEDKHLTAGVRSRHLVRFRRGYYTYPDLWSPLDAVARHRVRAQAVLHALGDNAALSHVSSVVAHGLPTWGLDLDRVHVTRLDRGTGRIDGDIVHHEGRVTEGDLREIDGLRTLTPDRSVIEAASTASAEAGLVLFDAFLHRRLGNHDDLFRRFEQMKQWPRTQHLHVAVRMADGDADGPGESRGRWLFWRYGLPAPLLQFRVTAPDGELRGVSDWAWPEHGLLGEFDGRLKYGRLVRDGLIPGDVVFAEKQREDALREITGYSMVRLVWSDYERPRSTVQRIEALLRRAV